MDRFKKYLFETGLSKESIKVQITTVNRYIAWLNKNNLQVEKAGYNDLMAYIKLLQQKGLKQLSIQFYINAIRHYYDYCQFRLKTVRKNPTKKIKIKGVKKTHIHDLFNEEELNNIYQNFKIIGLAGLRNKCILGLLVFQGIKSEELARLSPEDLKIAESKIHIAASRRSNARDIELKPFQLEDLQFYIKIDREKILKSWNKNSDKLFVSLGKSDHFNNTMQKMMESLRRLDSRIVSSKQLRASVLTEWAAKYNLRKTQYMAGHRYVSSTERYQVGNLEDLKTDVERFHPLM